MRTIFKYLCPIGTCGGDDDVTLDPDRAILRAAKSRANPRMTGGFVRVFDAVSRVVVGPVRFGLQT
jgi:hypothetical protein